MQLTPGVTIVQGPDGDELSVNGQKGINNNISVDGADFNNPFFGEQRGGQRPAFTFNQDAVKEMVVVADGAAPEFGRSGSRLRQRRHQVGHQHARPARRTSSSSTTTCPPKNSDGREVPVRSGAVRRDARRPAAEGQAVLLPGLRRAAVRPDQAARSEPHRAARGGLFAVARQPGRERPDRPHQRRARVPRQGRLRSSRRRTCLTVRYNYTWSEQQNGTFDVDSWGRSANAVERDFSNAVSGSLVTTLSSHHAERVPVPVRARGSPAAVRRPDITGQTRPFPDTAFDFGSGYRFGEPFFIPVDYYDTRFQFVDNLSWIKGRHTIKAGFEFNRVNSAQTFVGFANGRYIFGSTDGFLNYAQFGPNYVECSNGSTSVTGSCPAGASITGPAAAVPAAGRRRRPDGRGGGHAGHPADRAGAVHPGQVAADAAT